jgi:hypothetical protein
MHNSAQYNNHQTQKFGEVEIIVNHSWGKSTSSSIEGGVKTKSNKTTMMRSGTSLATGLATDEFTFKPIQVRYARDIIDIKAEWGHFSEPHRW